MGALRILVAFTMIWAAVALAVEVLIARGGGHRERSRPAGRPLRGLLYNFTFAMRPDHKETARFHPAEFVAGVALHVGVLAALAEVLWFLAAAEVGGRWLAGLRVLAAVGAVMGVALFMRRLRSPLLRALSTPDDYLAVAATCGLLVLAVFPTLASGGWLLTYAALLFLYVPLGKLRHAVFFFVARADFGWRLGYRGVYPPATEVGK